MSLTTQQKSELKRIIQLINKFLEELQETKAEKQIAAKPTMKQAPKSEPRIKLRRSRSELIHFRRQLKDARKAGVPVAKLAKQYGVTRSYIYQIA